MFELSFTSAVLVALVGLVLYFKDKKEARLHEKKIADALLAETRELFEKVRGYETNLDNFKATLVAVLKDMREVVKNTESERLRTAGVAAGTLLRPGKRQV